MSRAAVLSLALALGGCAITTVLRPAEWPEGIEILVSPPVGSPPLGVIEIDESGGIFGGGTIKGCREDMAKKAKELGATAMYVSSETRTQTVALEIFTETEVTCRAFAFGAVAHDVAPASAPTPAEPPAEPTPVPPKKSRR